MLHQVGVDAYPFQLNPEPIGNLPFLLQADTLIIDIPPKAGKVGADVHPKQIQYLINAVQQSRVEHIIYVSSTSVYPELNRIIVESDVTEPEQSAAPALVQAEQLVHHLASERMATVVRCGGLMGYDRIPGKYVAGRTIDTGAVPVNYIHRDDAVGVLMALVQQRLTGTFNAVAPEHPTREAIYRKSCADFEYELPTFSAPAEPVSYKIISPAKLLNAINYTFQYPDPLRFFYKL